MEISKIKGISEKREADFNKMGVYDTTDLMKFFPRAYIDLRNKQLLKYCYHNDMVLTCAKVTNIPVNRFSYRNNVVSVICEQEGLIFRIVWFNQPYVLNKLSIGVDYLFYGRVQKKNGEISMVNPTFEPNYKQFRLKGIVPQYTCKGSLTQKVVRDSVRIAVDLEKPKSIIPEFFERKYGLKDLYFSYKEVNNPTDFNSLKIASERIAIEEYFSLISAFKFIKGDRKCLRINKYSCSSLDLVEFIEKRFSFPFTDGQKQAVNSIFADMTSENVMNRLLQGDVGSGKTAVSMCAVYISAKSGYQSVVLSPTEVLARQNYNVIKNVFFDYNVEFLSGSTSLKEKKRIKEELKNGKIDILVGTHAVLTDDVNFNNLSLCICDEQQRFGVAQRSALSNKADFPDVLVMSATPIPRTLSLILYGDLDITTILDKPKSRLPVQTNIVPESKYMDMLQFVRKETKNGNKAYFVCPKIEGDEEGSIMNVTELFDELSKKLPDVKIGLLHGKMKDKEKEQVMDSFKNGDVDVLVSTTVIEVGVDVKNASVIVIYNAERFGLSQLHQLRGRVGRSDIKSYCFLLSNSSSETALERLSVIVNNTDGFKISEYDYKIRGSGDFIGERQSGKFMNDLGSLYYSTDCIFIAKKIADEVAESGKYYDLIKDTAIKRYDKLKNISFN